MESVLTTEGQNPCPTQDHSVLPSSKNDISGDTITRQIREGTRAPRFYKITPLVYIELVLYEIYFLSCTPLGVSSPSFYLFLFFSDLFYLPNCVVYLKMTWGSVL